MTPGIARQRTPAFLSDRDVSVLLYTEGFAPLPDFGERFAALAERLRTFDPPYHPEWAFALACERLDEHTARVHLRVRHKAEGHVATAECPVSLLELRGLEENLRYGCLATARELEAEMRAES